MFTMRKVFFSRQNGFSLVEAMVSMAIAVVVGASFYFLYNHQHKQYISEQVLSDMQANSRFIIDTMARDLVMTGYNPVSPPGISRAFSNSVTFEYWDDNFVPPANYDRHRQITFEVGSSTSEVTNPLTRKVDSYHSVSPVGYDSSTTYVIGDFIDSLAFEYYDNSNNLISPVPGTTLSERERIRSIKVTVRVRSSRKDLMTKPPAYKYMTLSRTFQARNLGIAGNPVDTNPPVAPVDVRVKETDPPACGMLDVQWTANSEADLAGYYIYVGQSAGSYIDKIKIGSPTATTYTLTDLTSTKSTDSTPVTYYIAMNAYDNSANNSALSTEVSGNPPTSTTTWAGTFTDTVIDTTINPVIPDAPGDFEATDGSGEGEVDLAWTPSTSADVVEYRLHRGDTPGFVPSGTAALSGNCIAVLDAAATSYTDTGLIGCQHYYYKIASVNCDDTLVPTYVVADDYAQCYGDGSLTDISPDVPTDTVTDSTPFDNTPITMDGTPPESVPQLSSIPGWRRVFLALKNPTLAGNPDFARTEIYFDKDPAGVPVIANCVVDESPTVPNSGGVFTAEGNAPANSFIMESETDPDPDEPLLGDGITYYYRAVTFDQCGNCNSIDGTATTKSNLCGDDPPGLPDCGPDPLAEDPIVITADTEGCSSYINLIWDGDCLKAGNPNNYDFSGFHVYRNEGQTYNASDATHVELTGGVPQWFQTFLDASAVEGKYYSYAVRWTDCAYEHDNGGNISDPAVNGGLIEGISLGQISSDNYDIITTGDLGLSPPTYEHNIVSFSIQNTSAGQLTINTMALSWENPMSYLQKIVIGDDSTTSSETVWEDTTIPLTFGHAGDTLTLNKTIEGKDGLVPVTLYFATSTGMVDYNSDLREDTITMDLVYTNETTGTATCGVTFTLNIPLGPTVTRTNQNYPSMPTFSWAVPGYGGTNTKDQIIVPGAVPVVVNTFVHDYSGSGISSVTVYYYVDESELLESAPAYDGTNYTALPMAPVSGDLWILDTGNEIPANDDSSVWFFIVAEDYDGNFDREPEVRAGAFQYYQQAADVCNDTPRAPVLSGETIGDQVNLSWTAPTQNTNSTPLTDLDGFRVYRNDGSIWVLLTDLPGAGSLTYSDTPPGMDTTNYSYYVSAYDTCTPPNESSASNIFSECVGAPPCLISVSEIGPVGGEAFNPGDSFAISLTVCSKINSTPLDEVYVQTCSNGSGDTDSVTMIETADTGLFSIKTDTTDPLNPRDTVVTYLAAYYPPGALQLDLHVTESDTITVGAYSDTSYPDAYGDCLLAHDCSTTITVVADPCIDPEVPGAPQNLTGKGTGNDTVTLTWEAGSGTVTGYRVYRSIDGAPFTQIDNLDSATFTKIDVPGGNLNDHDFSYYVTAINATCPGNTTVSAASNTITE